MVISFNEKDRVKKGSYTIIHKMDGSPCIKCLINATCNKSVEDNSICADYKLFIYTLIEKGNFKWENEDLH